MNARFAFGPLSILEILILVGVLFAVFALLRNPNGRNIFLTILTVVLVVGGVLFAGLFTLRVSHVPGPAMNSMPGPRALWNLPMMIKPLLMLLPIFLIVAFIKGVKNKQLPKALVIIVTLLLVPVLLFVIAMPIRYVREGQQSATVYNGPMNSVVPSVEVNPVVPPPPGYTVNSAVPLPPAYTTTPSIWQDSVANQFAADVYPSKAAALKGLRPKIDEALRKATEGKQTPPKVVLFAGGLTATEVHGLMDSPEVEAVAWTVEPLPRNLQENEISIAANFALTSERNESHGNRIVMKMQSGVLEVSISPSGQSSRTVLKAIVEEKPWLTDLSGYQSTYPNSRFLVARSHSSATDEKTAEHEAITEACSQVTQVLWEMNPNRDKFLAGNLSVNPTDLESRGLILDRFSQQLYGMAGPICRNAMLVDLSPEKIQPLANAKFEIVAQQQKTWTRILLSFVGMAAVIALVYAFLNAATRGYYSWSLRIAALVLLAAGVVIVLSLAGHFVDFPY